MSGSRRKLSAIDDPLALGRDVGQADAAPRRAPTRRGATEPQLPALFVRIPTAEFDALARAAFELGVHKRELVSALVWRYVVPSGAGLADLRALVDEHRRLSR